MSTRVTRSSTAAAKKDLPSKSIRAAKSSSPELKASDSSPEVQTREETSIFFWREYGSQDCYLSQWYPSPFHTGDPKGTVYQTAEQYMMHQKAILFADYPIASKIMSTTSPKAQKALGRKVSNFDQARWEAHRSRIVEDASYFKFKYGNDEGELAGIPDSEGGSGEGKGKSLKDRLLETGDKEIVEASPMDKIWGIGFGAHGAEEQRDSWGLNLLGKALMVARERLRAEENGSEDEKK